MSDIIIIPVPLHKKRLIWRGFNQAGELAKIINNKFQANLNIDDLIRIKNTKPQTKLSKIKRQNNNKKKYAYKPELKTERQRLFEICELAAKFFEKQLVSNGKDAMKTYQSWKPDIIVLDIMIPEMSGYMVLKEIRLNVGDKDTVIIMSTSISRKGSVMDCINLGIHGYIVKPFKTRELALKILDAYAQKKPARAKEIRQMLLKEQGKADAP